MVVDPSDNGALDPMIDRRRVPSLSGHFFLLGRVFDVAPRIGSFDLERPERFQMYPPPALTSLAWKVHVLPVASGFWIPVPSLGEYRQGPEFIKFQDRS